MGLSSVDQEQQDDEGAIMRRNINNPPTMTGEFTTDPGDEFWKSYVTQKGYKIATDGSDEEQTLAATTVVDFDNYDDNDDSSYQQRLNEAVRFQTRRRRLFLVLATALGIFEVVAVIFGIAPIFVAMEVSVVVAVFGVTTIVLFVKERQIEKNFIPLVSHNDGDNNDEEEGPVLATATTTTTAAVVRFKLTKTMFFCFNFYYFFLTCSVDGKQFGIIVFVTKRELQLTMVGQKLYNILYNPNKPIGTHWAYRSPIGACFRQWFRQMTIVLFIFHIITLVLLFYRNIDGAWFVLIWTGISGLFGNAISLCLYLTTLGRVKKELKADIEGQQQQEQQQEQQQSVVVHVDDNVGVDNNEKNQDAMAA